MASGDFPSYTVSGITAEIKGRLKGMDRIILTGEISGMRTSAAGHAYFTLKDASAQITVIMFAAAREAVLRKCGDVLRDGAKVDLFGAVEVYANRGNYQFVARSARLVGAGDLMQRYLALKARLEAEGLFDSTRKRPLPAFPRRIGIVTSETGAVIHDLCTVLTRRFPNLEIRLYPSLVQGETAARTIVAGIAYFNSCADWSADLLILARGGGSFEDLFCFNDEALVRALAASRIPTISAVGHETDFTLADFAADRRAGTPSIAAEMAVPLLSEILAGLRKSETSLTAALRGRGEWAAQRVDQLSDQLSASLQIATERARRRLALAQPRLPAALTKSLSVAERRLAGLAPRLAPALAIRLERERARFDQLRAKLALLSPYAVLERGYSLTTGPDGALVRQVRDVKPGDVITTRLADGLLASVVREN